MGAAGEPAVGSRMMVRSSLTQAQADGGACIWCGDRYGPCVVAGVGEQGQQVFACGLCQVAQREDDVARLRVDTSGTSFLVLVGPTPVVKFDTKRAVVDHDGRPLHSVLLLAVDGDGGAEVLAVRFPAEPAGLGAMSPNTAVRVVGLVATVQTRYDRAWLSFRAASVEGEGPDVGEQENADPVSRPC